MAKALLFLIHPNGWMKLHEKWMDMR